MTPKWRSRCTFSNCVFTGNAGTNETWMADARDLDGHPRTRAGLADIGAYQFVPAGTLIMVR